MSTSGDIVDNLLPLGAVEHWETGMENPFTPKFGYVPPVLAGRDEVLGRIAAGRASPARPESALLLIGRRGTGKTVLLHVAQDEAHTRDWVALFASGAEIGMCDKLASQAAGSVADPGARVVGVSAQVLGFGASIERSSPQPAPSEALRFSLARAAEAAADRGRGVMIAVDELQDAPAAEVRELAVAVQYVGSGRRLPVAFVGAGLPEFVAALLADAGLTFFHRCARADIGLLAESDARLALGEPIEAAGGIIHDRALEYAVAVTSGYPYMVQLVGYHSWEACADPRQGITLSDVALGEAAANRDMLAQVLLPSWSRLGDIERRVLSSMVPPGPAAPDEVAARAAADADAAAEALARLADAGLASISADGTVGIAHEAMRTWLRAGAGLRLPMTPSVQPGEMPPGSDASTPYVHAGAIAQPAFSEGAKPRSRRIPIVESLLNDVQASCAAIARAHGVSRQYVSRIAKEEDISRARKAGSRARLDDRESEGG